MRKRAEHFSSCYRGLSSDQYLRQRSPIALHYDTSWLRPTLEICDIQWTAAPATRRHNTSAGDPGRFSRRRAATAVMGGSKSRRKPQKTKYRPRGRPTLSSRWHSWRPRWRSCRQEHQWLRRHWPAPVNGSTPCIGNQHHNYKEPAQ